MSRITSIHAACSSCGIPWVSHAGTITQCAQLIAAKAEVKRLKAKVRRRDARVAELRLSIEELEDLTGARV